MSVDLSFTRDSHVAFYFRDKVFSPKCKLLLNLTGDTINPIIFIDSELYDKFKEMVTDYFLESGVICNIYPVESSEEKKSWDSVVEILKVLSRYPLRRGKDSVVAIGGGVLMDVVGFSASLFRRGVDYIKIPTTLIGYVDASAGIKTGINFFGRKNLIGTFHPPKAVILDKVFLKDLPKRHIINGIGEIIKMALICNPGIFSALEKNINRYTDDSFQEDCWVIDSSFRDMLEELTKDFYESSKKRAVDLGHTFSPALELSNSDFLHGESVMIDIVLTSIISLNRNILSTSAFDRVISLINKTGVDLSSVKMNKEVLWESVLERQLHRGGCQHVPVVKNVGEVVFLEDISQVEVEVALIDYASIVNESLSSDILEH